MSKRFSLSREDFRKIGVGFLVAVGGSALYGVANGIQLFSDQTDFGVLEGLSIAVCSALVNAIRKWASDLVMPSQPAEKTDA